MLLSSQESRNKSPYTISSFQRAAQTQESQLLSGSSALILIPQKSAYSPALCFYSGISTLSRTHQQCAGTETCCGKLSQAFVLLDYCYLPLVWEIHLAASLNSYCVQVLPVSLMVKVFHTCMHTHIHTQSQKWVSLLPANIAFVMFWLNYIQPFRQHLIFFSCVKQY